MKTYENWDKYTHQSYFGAAGPALCFQLHVSFLACFGLQLESQALEAYECRETNKKQQVLIKAKAVGRAKYPNTLVF